MIKNTTKDSFIVRRERIRRKLRSVSGDRLRLSIFRSNQHIEAQIIDDSKGSTLLYVSSSQKWFDGANGSTTTAAEIVGKKIAELSIEKKISNVYVDRGGYAYDGRVKALCDAARSAGLSF